MNHKFMSKLISFLLVTCMILSLSACSKKEVTTADNTNQEKNNQQQPKKEEPKKQIELSFWNVVDDPNNAMSKRFDESVKQVEKDMNLKIRYEAINGQTYHTKLKVALAGNELPDMFVIHPGEDRDPFITSKAAEPLNDVLESTGMKDKFYEGYLPVGDDNNIYSLPFRTDMTEVMFYNKKVFKEVGIEVPKNWEEFKAAVEAIKAKGYEAIGLGNKDRWMGDLVYNTMVLREDPLAFDKALKGEMKYDSKPFLNAAQKVQELAKMDAFQKGYMGAVEAEVVEMFEAGKVAMYFIGTWAFDDLVNRLGDDLGYAPFPAIGLDSNPAASICGTRNAKPWGFMVSSKSANVDISKKALLKFVTINNDLLVKTGGIPYIDTDVKIESDINPEFSKYIEDMKKIKFIQTYWADYLPKNMGEPYRDLNQKLFTGDLDPQEYVTLQQEILGAN